MSLLMLKCFIPGYFWDVTTIICRPANVQDVPDIYDVASRIRQLRSDLLNWHSRYESYVRSTSKVPPGSAEYDSHCKVFATYLCCMIISTRLLSSLSAIERLELERYALLLAEQMFKLEDEVREVSLQTTLFLAQTLGVSQSIKITTGDWVPGSGSDYGSVSPTIIPKQEFDDSNEVISRWKFEAWNNICGRKLPSPYASLQ